MNLLIVDDQVSVLNGLTNSVPFSDYGISKVFTATNVDDARSILIEHPIDILFSDIEMPGEDGLSLVAWVQEHYPAVLRVLLTSHASFTYAQKSVKLGCFDYIVQPATKEEIGDLLSRATAKLVKERQHSLYHDNLFMSGVVENLFSRNEENREMARTTLNDRGYALNPDSIIRLAVINLYPYQTEASNFKPEYDIYTVLLNAASFVFTGNGVVSLICKNRFKQFVLLLYSNNSAVEEITNADFVKLHETIQEIVSPKVTTYVSNLGTYSTIGDVITSANLLYLNDVTKEYKVNFTSEASEELYNRNLSENITRWSGLLERNQYSTLENNIFAYLDYNLSIGKINYASLSEFHQELSKLIFLYLYQQDISIHDLFSEEFSYSDFMNCFNDLQTLKDGISYILERISEQSDLDTSQNLVEKAQHYILSNLSSDISVKDVAEYVHLNPEYFSKLFKKETGENVKTYILRIKVEAAKDMLEKPNIPVSAVSLELGYTNFSHFTQMFKKHEGVTPSEYRKEFLQKKGETLES